MGKIITVANEKGGVGKTILTVNLAAALSLRGQRVLVIDMDPQGNASYMLSKNIADENLSMYKVLVNKDEKISSIIEETATENLDLAPSNLHLAGAEIRLVQEYGREFTLKWSFTPEIIEQYDYIFIDTAPSLSLLTVNALVAADYILIPGEVEVKEEIVELVESPLIPPPKERVAAVKTRKKEEEKEWSLTAILSSEASSQAIINHEIVREGDTLWGGKVKVIKIMPKKVILSREGKTFTLKLGTITPHQRKN